MTHSASLAVLAIPVAVTIGCTAPPATATAVPAAEQRVAALESTVASIREELTQSRSREQELMSAVEALHQELRQFQDFRSASVPGGSDGADTVSAPSDPVVDGGGAVGESAVSAPVVAPHVYRYLRIGLTSAQILEDGVIRATMEFSNTDKTRGLALAQRAEHSDGIADFWKFNPRPIGSATGQSGARFRLSEKSSLGFARDSNDWLIMKPEETMTRVFDFTPQSEPFGDAVVSLTFDLRIVTKPDSGSRQDVSTSTVVFRDVRVR